MQPHCILTIRPLLTTLHNHLRTSWPLLLILGIGLAIRLIALAQLAIINPDGIIYINQAKAISSGQWHLLTQCHLPYVSLYPFLIAWIHHVVPNWILSGQLISLVGSMGMLLVISSLLRLFLERTTSQLTTLLLALTPVFIRYSVDVMRDALFWFFFSLSLWLLLLHIRRHMHGPISSALLLAGNAAMLLAAWSRIEAIVLLPATCLFLWCDRGNHNLRRLLIFVLPTACLAVVGGAIALMGDHDVFTLVRINEILQKFSEPINAYHTLRHDLKVLADGYGFSLMGNYLQNSYHTIWATVLGGILANTMESFFYPYVIFYIAGVRVWCQCVRHQAPYRYVAVLLACSVCVLLVHFLQHWVMTSRFLTLLIIPSSVIAGLGIQRTVDYCSCMPHMGRNTAIILIALMLFLVSIEKNIQKFEDDKAVYVNIGKKVGLMENTKHPILIASRPSVASAWITFYANANQNLPSYQQLIINESASMDEILSMMRTNGASLLLLEETVWKKTFSCNTIIFDEKFKRLGKWHHKDTGDMILYHAE